jgi:hypothetical protein
MQEREVEPVGGLELATGVEPQLLIEREAGNRPWIEPRVKQPGG